VLHTATSTYDPACTSTSNFNFNFNFKCVRETHFVSAWLVRRPRYEANLWINYNEGRNFSSSVIHYDMNHQMM
jgi:hypothetical protein